MVSECHVFSTSPLVTWLWCRITNIFHLQVCISLTVVPQALPLTALSQSFFPSSLTPIICFLNAQFSLSSAQFWFPLLKVWLFLCSCISCLFLPFFPLRQFSCSYHLVTVSRIRKESLVIRNFICFRNAGRNQDSEDTSLTLYPAVWSCCLTQESCVKVVSHNYTQRCREHTYRE